MTHMSISSIALESIFIDFCFYFLCLWGLVQKIHVHSNVLKCFLCVFRDPGLIFRHLLYFELIFVSDEIGVQFILPYVGIQLSQYYLLKTGHFTAHVLSSFVKDQMLYCTGLLLGSVFYPISLRVYFYANIMLHRLAQLVIHFKVRQCNASCFVLLLKITLDIQDLLWFLINFSSIFYSSEKKSLEL